MKCHDIDNKIDKLLEGELSQQEAKKILKHIKKCNKCHEKAYIAEAVEMFLRNLTSSDNGKTFLLKQPPILDKNMVNNICSLIGIKSPYGDLIAANPTQPRREWDVEKDEEGKTKIQRLAQSIKEQGLLSPLIVMRQNGKFIIICGERRFRAIKEHTTMKEIPCIVRENLTESEIVETSVTENLQREDLTPMDEAKAFQLLMEKCGYSQKKLGQKFGLSVAAVNYKLSLLKLSPELQTEVRKGNLSETDGRAISQAVNRVPSTKEEKVTAMKEIKDKVDQARETNGGKLKTKEVATIAKTVVEKVAKPNGSRMAKDDKPAKIQPPTKTEIAGAKEFAKAVIEAAKTLHKHIESASKKDTEGRLRFAFVLMETEKNVLEHLRAMQQFLMKLSEEIAEVKRQNMVSKLK